MPVTVFESTVVALALGAVTTTAGGEFSAWRTRRAAEADHRRDRDEAQGDRLRAALTEILDAAISARSLVQEHAGGEEFDEMPEEMLGITERITRQSALVPDKVQRERIDNLSESMWWAAEIADELKTRGSIVAWTCAVELTNLTGCLLRGEKPKPLEAETVEFLAVFNRRAAPISAARAKAFRSPG